MTDGPRLIGRKEAAAYCGIGESTFSMWVANHKMPAAIPGTRRWDKAAIDAKLDEISGLAAREVEDPYEKWMRENRKVDDRSGDSLSEWREKKEKRRAKYQPQMGLDAKLERILVFMVGHPDCATIDVIPGAGPVLMERLVESGAIRRSGGECYLLTEIGAAEAARIKKWRQLEPL